MGLPFLSQLLLQQTSSDFLKDLRNLFVPSSFNSATNYVNLIRHSLLHNLPPWHLPSNPSCTCFTSSFQSTVLVFTFSSAPHYVGTFNHDQQHPNSFNRGFELEFVSHTPQRAPRHTSARPDDLPSSTVLRAHHLHNFHQLLHHTFLHTGEIPPTQTIWQDIHPHGRRYKAGFRQPSYCRSNEDSHINIGGLSFHRCCIWDCKFSYPIRGVEIRNYGRCLDHRSPNVSPLPQAPCFTNLSRLIAMYVFELFYRPKISPVSVGHHIGTIMIGQSAIAISLNLIRERDATIEFILCTVWGTSFLFFLGYASY